MSSSATAAMAGAREASTCSSAVKWWRHPKLWPKLLDSSVVLDQIKLRHAMQWDGGVTVSRERCGAAVMVTAAARRNAPLSLIKWWC